MSSILFALTTAFSIYGVSFYRSHGTLPGNTVAKDPERPESDNLEHTGISPHAYDELNGQQEMEQHNAQDEEVSPTQAQDEGNATIPPRPMSWQIPLAAGTQTQGFEPVDTSYHGAQAHDPRQYNPGPSPYQDYSIEAGDYTLHGFENSSDPHPPPRYAEGLSPHPPPTAELPSLRVDTTFTQPHRPYAGDRLSFPAADYGR